MITQYSEYGTVSADIQNLIASKISALDKYVLMRTGDNEYTALVHNPLSKDTTQYIVSRTGQNYGYTWEVNTIENVDYRFNISNEYYVYSNEGYGRMLDLPCYEAITSFSTSMIACAMILCIVFKGVLFKCLRKR